MTHRAKRLLMATVVWLAVLANVAVASAVDYGLKVCNVEVTNDNKENVLNDGTVSYDPDTKTLTLNDATLTYSFYDENNNITTEGAAIKSDQELNIKLIGKNTISSTNASGIVAVNGLTISSEPANNGSLAITSNVYGILSTSAEVKISNTTVNATVNEPDVNKPEVQVTAPPAYGVAAQSLSVTNSTLKASVNGDGQGITAMGSGIGIADGGSVTISGISTVEADGGLSIRRNIPYSPDTEISNTATLTVKLATGQAAKIKVGSDNANAQPLSGSPYKTNTSFSGDAWKQLVQVTDNKPYRYFYASIQNDNTPTPPGGGTATTPEGGTGVPLPEDEIPVVIPPKTGDNAPLLLYCGALLVSGAGIALITVHTRKRRENR